MKGKQAIACQKSSLLTKKDHLFPLLSTLKIIIIRSMPTTNDKSAFYYTNHQP